MRPECFEYERRNGILMLCNNTGFEWVYAFPGTGTGGIMKPWGMEPVPEVITTCLLARFKDPYDELGVLNASMRMFLGLSTELDRK